MTHFKAELNSVRNQMAVARVTNTESKLAEFNLKLNQRKDKLEELHIKLKIRKERLIEREERLRIFEKGIFMSFDLHLTSTDLTIKNSFNFI